MARERWRNGAGWTRTVASVQQGEATLWRISLAEISRASAFSQFPGMDRTAVLVQGGPLMLRQLPAPARQWSLLQPGDNAQFAGELTLDNLAPQTEALVWNVMLLRGQVDAQVEVSAHALLHLAVDRHNLVWLLQGAYVVMTEDGNEVMSLKAGEGLQSSPGGPPWRLRPTSPDARLLLTTISEPQPPDPLGGNLRGPAPAAGR